MVYPVKKEENKMTQTTQQVPLNEMRKRQAVLIEKPGTVQISIPRMQMVGLPQVAVDRKEKDAKIAIEVAERGLSASAYREKPDSGFCVINGVSEVSLEYVIGQLTMIGLYYSGGRIETWRQENGSFACKTVFDFSADVSRKQPLPQNIDGMFAKHVFKIFVWANWRFKNEEKGRDGGQYRLDTINCAEQRILGSDQKPVRHLNVKGNSYDVAEG